MAYENMTYEVILERMMERVKKDYPNLDYREGSMIFNALASAAIELTIMYTELDNILNESFVGTASREYILIACEQMGMDTSVFEASASVHKGEFDVEIPIGSRWNCDLYNYTVTDYLGVENSKFTYRMVCESVGAAPNNLAGDLTPITDAPNGLTYAKLTECLIEGADETSDESIRTAYYNHINNVASDGNIQQYLRWCKEYDGIGNAKVFPLWNGANTVKVSILNESNQKASDTLIEEFQEYLDPNSEGMGNGVAPIGSVVTVSTATEVPITVSAIIALKPGYSDTSTIDEALTNYFASIAYDTVLVPYLTVGSVILNAEGVESVHSLTIETTVRPTSPNGNIVIQPEEIPVLAAGVWTVK